MHPGLAGPPITGITSGLIKIPVARFNSKMDRCLSATAATYSALAAPCRSCAASQIRLEKQQEILQFSGSELRYLGLRKNTAPKETSNPSFELTQLLAAQDRQGAAKAEYVAAVADKHRSIFELNRATGILILSLIHISEPTRPY